MASLKKQSNSIKPQKKLVLPILLVCEDSDGAVSYLEQRIKSANLTCAKTKRINVDATILGGQGQHHTLVKNAIKELESNLKTSNQQLELPYDKIYCVMDYDVVLHDIQKSQKAIMEAYRLIKQENAKLKNAKSKTRLQHVVSNDCFELWYLLHFWTEKQVSTSPLFRPKQQPDAKKSIGRLLWTKLKSEKEEYNDTEYENLVKSKKDSIYALIQQKGGSEAQAIKNTEKLENLHRQNPQTSDSFLLFHHNPSTDVHCLIKKFENMQKRMNNTHFST